MADTVAVTTIQDGDKNAVFYLTNTSDGTGESAVTKIDVSGLAKSGDGTTCTGVRVEKVVFTTVGMSVKLLWDATADVLAIELPANYSDTVDFSDISGIPNYSGSGKTGDVKLTTVGHASGESYSIIIYTIKEF